MLVACLGDIHFPYHSLQAWDLALQLCKAAQPDLIHLIGDVIDCEAISDFHKPPERLLGFQREIDVAVRELGRLREACPDAQMEYREGNHEFRLKRMLWSKSIPLSSLSALTVPELLNFEELGVTWLPEEQRRHVGRLWFLHGHEQKASFLHPARGLYMKLGGNVIVGHFHKFDKHVHKQFRGSAHGVWVNACLSTLTPDYLVNAQWEHGITLIDFSANGFFKVYPITFDPTAKSAKQLYATWQGVTYQAG